MNVTEMVNELDDAIAISAQLARAIIELEAIAGADMPVVNEALALLKPEHTARMARRDALRAKVRAAKERNER